MSRHLEEAIDKGFRLARRPDRLHGVWILKVVVVVIDRILSEQAKHRSRDLILLVQCRAPCILPVRIVSRDGRAPDGEAIGGQLIAAVAKGIDAVVVGEMRRGDRIHVPRCHCFCIAANDAPEGGHGRVGELSAFVRTVADGVGDGHMIVPLPLRISAPRNARIVADLTVHLEPDSCFVTRRHFGFEKFDKWTFDQRVVLQQPRCRKLMRLDESHLLAHGLHQVHGLARFLGANKVHDVDGAQ